MGVAFVKAIPLLVAEDVEVKNVEHFQVAFDRRCLRLVRRGWVPRMLGGGLRGEGGAKREARNDGAYEREARGAGGRRHVELSFLVGLDVQHLLQ